MEGDAEQEKSSSSKLHFQNTQFKKPNPFLQTSLKPLMITAICARRGLHTEGEEGSDGSMMNASGSNHFD